MTDIYKGIKFIDLIVLEDGTRITKKRYDSLTEKPKILYTTRHFINSIEGITDTNELFNTIKQSKISSSLKKHLINEFVRKPYTEQEENRILSSVSNSLNNFIKLDNIKKEIWKNSLLLFSFKKDVHNRINDVIENGFKYYTIKIKVQKSKNTRARTGRKVYSQQKHKVNLEITLNDFKTHTLDNIDIFRRIINPINHMISKEKMAPEVWDTVEFTSDDVKISDDIQEDYTKDLLKDTITEMIMVLSTSNFPRPTIRSMKFRIKLDGQIIDW